MTDRFQRLQEEGILRTESLDFRGLLLDYAILIILSHFYCEGTGGTISS